MFGFKLSKQLLDLGDLVTLDDTNVDLQLSFIQAINKHDVTVQRLDGIYFNSAQDWNILNRPIKSTYDSAKSVIFQSIFNQKLSEKYFGKHRSSHVIHNGTDIETISRIDPITHPVTDEFENVWCCASSWRPHKRLKENVMYFLEHASERDCLVIAGSNPDFEISHPRIFYVGNLDWTVLISLYKRSKYFVHLALMDHCPNVVVDARASGCHIICSDSGGTKEIAGKKATIIKDMEWDFSPFKLYEPPKLDFNLKSTNVFDNDIDIKTVAKKYKNVFTELV